MRPWFGKSNSSRTKMLLWAYRLHIFGTKAADNYRAPTLPDWGLRAFSVRTDKYPDDTY